MVALEAQTANTDWSRFATPPIEKGSEEWLELDSKIDPNHFARLISPQVDALDFSSLVKKYKFSGSPPLRPDLMLKMVLFCYHRGLKSPAQWLREADENLVMQWLGCGVQPSRSVWYEFTTRIAPFLDDWNGEVLAVAAQHEMLSEQGGSLDGSTVAARASRHRLLTLDQVRKRREALTQSIEADQGNDRSACDYYWMANTARGRLDQQDRYRSAQRVLKKKNAENDQRIPSKRKSPDKIRVSVTDPEAPLGMDKLKVYRPLYNIQLLRDLGSPFILGYETFARPGDTGTLIPMVDRGRRLAGGDIKKLLVDSGYVTGLDLFDALQSSIDLYGPWKSNDYSANRKSNESKAKLSKDDFLWIEEKLAYECPAGKLLTRRGTQTKKRSQGRTEAIGLYRADKATCQGCELKATCCPKSKSGRNLNRSEHEPLIEAHKKKWNCRTRKRSTSFAARRWSYHLATPRNIDSFAASMGTGL